jgi:hypothetical protein
VIWGGGWLGRARSLSICALQAGFVESVALAADLDQVPVVHESVQERRDGWRVAEEFWSVLQGTVRRDDRRGAPVAAHDNLEQVFGGRSGEFAHAEIVDDQQRHRA